jgi:WD40-like Beta Propeller Repeat
MTSTLIGLALLGATLQTAPTRVTSVTFAETIAPILYDNCVVCHRRGQAAPFSLVTYEDARSRGTLIAKVTQARYMPPWKLAHGYGEFVGERRLTDAQIAAIDQWVKLGMPRGDDSKMPKLPAFNDDWRLGTPDLVLEMAEGFDVPASGPDVFRNFALPTKLTEDKWVRAVEYRPSARRVVHHALFAWVPGGSTSRQEGADGKPGFGGMGSVGVVANGGNTGGLGGWAVGGSPFNAPDGFAMLLPKGSDFLLQAHFHPTGRAETEKAQIGLYFTQKPPDRDMASVELPALFGFGAHINIPAGESNFTVTDSFTLPGDVKIYSTYGHAHYLGKEMKVDATLPDGSKVPLVWLPDWDFNWQDFYLYKTPVTLPKGTRIDAVLRYDNSATNRRNPSSPPRRVLWGEQSFDEMGTVGLLFEIVNKDEVPAVRQALLSRTQNAIRQGAADGTAQRFLEHQNRLRLASQRMQLTIFDRSGNVVSRVGEPASYTQPAFSPDGTRIAVIRTEPESGNQGVWTLDVATGKATAVATDETAKAAPVWSPDGKQIAYIVIRENVQHIYRKAANGTGAEELLYRNSGSQGLVLTDWSADGRFICFWAPNDTMYLLPVDKADGDRKPIELKRPDFFGRGGRLSPDGKYLAYNSNASGKFEVYVRPMDTTGNASASAGQISKDGGVGGIVWRRDGKEIFFLSGNAIMAVDLGGGPSQPGTPTSLFRFPSPIGAPAQLSTIVSADGQRFVQAVAAPPRSPAR